GVLSHLERLEARARALALRQEAAEQRQEQLARLKGRAQELRLRRDELRAKVELQQKRLLGNEGVATSGDADAAQPSDRAVLEWKMRNVQDLLQLFYLTGLSGKRTKHGVCFCISTAYEGTYLDSFYLDLVTKPQVQIRRHSVPVFIPLEELARKHLQTDIKRFLSVLSDHLNAYVGRRYQADQLQERFSGHLEGTLQRNSLCNVLVFKYNTSGQNEAFPFSARLLYGDPCRSLPTEAVVSCTSGAPAPLAEATAAHADAFRRLPLHRALEALGSPRRRPD
ncbi:CENPO protein, partial [Nothocercus julius]|nr:CENPO protein [Nothocercus julius]